MATTANWTLLQLEADGGPPGPWEIIDGEMIPLSPGGGQHSQIGATIIGWLFMANRTRPAGVVYGADAGVVVQREPLTLRAPDVAFIRTGRLPEGFDRTRFLPVVPDFLVEIISPSDRSPAVIAKVDMWLKSGCSMVWIVEPVSETVAVYERDAAPVTYAIGETLPGIPGLPEFQLPVAEIFANP